MAVAVAMAVTMPVAVTVSVGSSLSASTTAARAPSAGPSAIPGRYLVSEPRHSMDTESQSSRSSGEGDQCSAVQPHNITSHLDHNVSYAQRVVLEAYADHLHPASSYMQLLVLADEDAHVPSPSLCVSANGQLWV